MFMTVSTSILSVGIIFFYQRGRMLQRNPQRSRCFYCLFFSSRFAAVVTWRCQYLFQVQTLFGFCWISSFDMFLGLVKCILIGI